jgi:hypothetical protein
MYSWLALSAVGLCSGIGIYQRPPAIPTLRTYRAFLTHESRIVENLGDVELRHISNDEKGRP